MDLHISYRDPQMNTIYSFVWKRQENMSDIVSVHWQQGKFQLCANCFMSWRPVSNAGLGISKTPSAAHWCVQRPKYSVMSRIGTSFNTRIHIYEVWVWVYSSVPWHSYGNITSPLVSIRPYRDRRSRRITAFVNLICPYRLFSRVS